MCKYYNPLTFARKYFENEYQETKNNSKRILPDEDKLDFLKASLFWIERKDIMGCLLLNFGYEAPLPWPQVFSELNVNYENFKKREKH